MIVHLNGGGIKREKAVARMPEACVRWRRSSVRDSMTHWRQPDTCRSTRTSWSGWLLQDYVEKKVDAELDGGCPSALWIAMGTDIGKELRGPSWYNKYACTTCADTGFQREQAAALGRERLRLNMHGIIRNLRKIISTWFKPLYQSIWSGPMQPGGQTTCTPLLLSLYGDEKAEGLAGLCAKAVSQLLYPGVCTFLFLGGRKERGWVLMLLYWMGGVAFHLFWESKSQYVYPCVFCLIPFSAAGIRRMMQLAGKRMKKPETADWL
ncbi:MAG: hypothetical protein ACI4ML_01445 [Aristaeellaceae bacterium]